MKPDAIYYFQRMSEHPNRYKQTKHSGKIIPRFPSVCKKGKNKGEQYIVFKRTSYYHSHTAHRFSHTIELAGRRIITGLAFMPEYPQRTYGTFKEYALLIEVSDNFEKLTVWFFKGLQAAAPILFQRWQAGLIAEVVRTNMIWLRYRANLQDW